MTDKPRGPAAAAREIDGQYTLWDIEEGSTTPEYRFSVVTNIILKHCPEDKAVEKLVEAAKNMCEASNIDYGFCKPQVWHDALTDLETALTDYEKVKK